MPNRYYESTDDLIVDGTLASASDIENKLAGVESGFDTVETEMDKKLTLSGADVTDWDISELAAARAYTNIGFDASGDLVLNTVKGTYQGEWATTTYYRKEDIVKDAAGGYGEGNDAILICLETHTSSDLVTDNAKWAVILSTTDLDTAVAAAEAAQAAAETAETNAETAETNAAASEAAASTSETNAATSETNAEAAYDNFDDRYLGAKATNPTLDNDGDALLTGAMYWNTADSTMRVYSGSSWSAVLGSASNVEVQTATAGQTVFTLATISYQTGVNNLSVYVNGVRYIASLYTETDTTTVTMDSGLTEGDIVEFITSEMITDAVVVSIIREAFTATAGQTLVTLSQPYQQGVNHLQVYVNGVRMSVGTHYTETSTTSITFTSGLVLNDEVTTYMYAVNSVGVTDAASVTYTPAGTGAVATNVQTKLRESASTADLGMDNTGATDVTTEMNNLFSENNNVVILAGTYQGKFILPSECNVYMVGNPVFKLPTGINDAGISSVLTITGDDVSIFGQFTCDGTGATNTYTTSGGTDINGTLSIEGNNVSIHDLVTVKDAYFVGLSVWNGTDTSTGASVENLYINKILIDNSAAYSAYLWSIDGFRINHIEVTTGALSGTVADYRVRTGTESSSSLECKNGYIGYVENAPCVIESRTAVVHFGLIDTIGSKIDNGNNITIDKIHMVSQTSASSIQAFSFNNEFTAIGSANIRIGSIYIDDVDVASTDTINLGYAEEVTIDSITIIDSPQTSGINARDCKNVLINKVYIDNSGVTNTNGVLVSSGYTLDNLIFNSVYSTGNTTYDVVANQNGATFNHIVNEDAVTSIRAISANSKNIDNIESFTVGAAGDFTTLVAALVYVQTNYNSVINATNKYNQRVTITLLSGYTVETGITFDGIDLGWVTIKSDIAVTNSTTSGTNFMGSNGAVLPKIEGSYNNVGGYFMTLDTNASCVCESLTITASPNITFLVQYGGKIDLTAASLTATGDSIYVRRGGQGILYGATFGGLSIFDGGIAYAAGSTGTLSDIANAITAAGIIFK